MGEWTLAIVTEEDVETLIEDLEGLVGMKGATVGGLIGGPLGIVAGIAIANDPSVEWGESQNDDS